MDMNTDMDTNMDSDMDWTWIWAWTRTPGMVMNVGPKRTSDYGAYTSELIVKLREKSINKKIA
jgi:hypothetical protein